MSNAALSKARHLEATRKGWEQKLREDYERENGFLRDLNETLLRDSKILREENEKKTAELREKEDQLRDLMVYLEAQAMVASHPGEEMGEGSWSGCPFFTLFVYQFSNLIFEMFFLVCG